MKTSLQVLHIEDSTEDSELIHQMLRRGGFTCEMKRVETRDQTFDELENGTYDLILADCKLPSFSGLHALELAHALKPEVPFVFVSGTIGEETAIESLRNGATDYVLKDSLNRLVPAVRRAMAEAEERKLCRQLQQRLREAGRLEAVSTLSNGIAHDFNNILTIILGHASLLSMEYDRPERVLELTETIAQAARRASDVVQQLLAFARKSEGHAVPANLNRRVQDSLSLLRANLPPNVDFALELAPELPSVRIDSAQFERMLSNLVSNAVEACRTNGGRVTFSTALVKAEQVPGLAPELATKEYVRLSVADNGEGMDTETRQHIFEPFYTTKERGRGTGLGLPVVYGLIQAHNGWIDIQSELSVGTTVSLFFPVPDNAKRAPVSPRSDPTLSGSETILVIEDEADVGFYLETVFQNHGYPTFLAHDHDQALALFQAHRDQIKLVFSDFGLPKVDGIAICAELLKLKPELRVVLSSGYSPMEFKDRMQETGITAFVPKPYNTGEILRNVRAVLDEPQAAKPA